MICVSKNEAACCEVQTHFGSFRLSGFMKRFWSHFPKHYRYRGASSKQTVEGSNSIIEWPRRGKALTEVPCTIANQQTRKNIDLVRHIHATMKYADSMITLNGLHDYSNWITRSQQKC